MESTEPHAIFVWNSMTSLKLTVEKLLKVVGIFLSFKLSHLWSCKGEYTGLFASKTVFCSVFFITAFDFGCKKILTTNGNSQFNSSINILLQATWNYHDGFYRLMFDAFICCGVEFKKVTSSFGSNGDLITFPLPHTSRKVLN